MTSVDVFTQAATAAHTAFLDATLDGDDVEERLDAALTAYRAVLTASGCLTAPHLQPTPEELDQTAEWLAGKSEFPRYADSADGWHALRRSGRHVKIAYSKALDLLRPGEDDLAAALSTAKSLLIAHAEDGVETAAGGVL